VTKRYTYQMYSGSKHQWS